MKKFILLLVIITGLFFLISCEKETVTEPVNDITLKNNSAKTDSKLTGFDQWGYNWQAHQFNGYLINAMFGDELYPDAPWYKKEPPFNGDVLAYEESHPEVLEYDFWQYGDMELVMHWNEAMISRDGVYQEPILDSDGWITFHYRKGEGDKRWSQFQKFVCAKSTDYKEIYFYDDKGNPVFGEWFSKDDKSIGWYYQWPDRILIQVVNTGNLPEGFLPTFRGPLGPGIGNYIAR